VKATTITVIIDAGATTEWMHWSLESTLRQRLHPAEILVLDPHHSVDVAALGLSCGGSRVRHVVPPANANPSLLLGEAIAASSSTLIAVLEPGSAFHPEKLATHAQFMDAHPHVDLTYSGRWELDHRGRVDALWSAPSALTIHYLVAGAPLSASEIVIRKEAFQRRWRHALPEAGRLGFVFGAFLAAPVVASVDRALVYRRRASPRARELAGRAEAERLEALLAHDACSAELEAIRGAGLARVCLGCGLEALLRGDRRFGQGLIRKAIRLDRSILDLKARDLLGRVVWRCLEQDGDHGAAIRQVVAGLPDELAWISRLQDRAVAMGHVERGIRAAFNSANVEARQHFADAGPLGASLDERFWHELLDRVIGYERECGLRATRALIASLIGHLRPLATRRHLRRFRGSCHAALALGLSRQGMHEDVPGCVARAIWASPGYVANRGMWGVLKRSLMRSRRAANRVHLLPHSAGDVCA
jgi:hypothetical protein